MSRPISRPISNRVVTFARRPEGLPDATCFALESRPLPALAEGQVLVENHYLSLDPYIRMRMEAKDSYAPVMALGETMVGRTVGQVIESRDAAIPEGSWVVGRLGWQDYSVGTKADVQFIHPDRAPLSAYLGSLGSTGITAWIGLVHIAGVKEGESVLVSAASGAVGSVVGQLARARGCRVVGIAGGARKCGVVRERFGFDDCVDYKAPDFTERLAQAAGPGFDIYFDNVGGPIFDATLPLMRLFGRIPLCGLVSQYNAAEPYGVRNLREVFNKRLTIRGFVISDHRDVWDMATQELERAYAEGRLVYEETVIDGLENAPDAFIGMLQGGNIGKQLVRIKTA
ncbi:NADP-dependent oxidoreductase [Ancylobacter polymorphus]|uniref:NADPH-dependent curcumin reductase CurA n=1 Tax=Ancylobacter polymorphus TaxID=223390 RepID=A0ABU0BC23_9HYPH|nr:NADP-dependent oxidoreductase [Ancylobacter polymorphus]MDQ0302950.1 NADPH-dependent curcumin reductase CurA [Ancylobacter polymorphus]